MFEVGKNWGSLNDTCYLCGKMKGAKCYGR